jgi:hypothetical protein
MYLLSALYVTRHSSDLSDEMVLKNKWVRVSGQLDIGLKLEVGQSVQLRGNNRREDHVPTWIVQSTFYLNQKKEKKSWKPKKPEVQFVIGRDGTQKNFLEW